MVPNSVSYCRAEPSKASAAAPRPRKRGRFRVAISDRPPSPRKEFKKKRGEGEGVKSLLVTPIDILTIVFILVGHTPRGVVDTMLTH